MHINLNTKIVYFTNMLPKRYDCYRTEICYLNVLTALSYIYIIKCIESSM